MKTQTASGYFRPGVLTVRRRDHTLFYTCKFLFFETFIAFGKCPTHVPRSLPATP